MAKGDTVARLPAWSDSDEWCSICGDDNVVVVLDGQRAKGTSEIVMDSIHLCSWCFSQMKQEIKDLGI